MAEAVDDEVDPIDAHFDAADARIETLCTTTLHSRIQALEADRLKVRRAIVRGVVVLGVPVVLFFFSEEVAALLRLNVGSEGAAGWLADNVIAVTVGLFLLAMAWIAIFLAMPAMAAYLNYRQRFKTELVAPVFHAVMPSAAYLPDHHVTRAVFDSSGLWTNELSSFTGDDLMRGRIGSTEFEASELRALGTVLVQRTRKREGITRRPNATLFAGMFFHIGLERPLRGHTIVEPEATGSRPSDHRRGFQRIDLGDEAFAEHFRVYTTDPAEAAEVLNPRVRERLSKLADYFSNYPFLSFVGPHMFVAIHSGAPLLEPTIAKPASYGALSAIGEFFALPELLVRELAPGAPIAETFAPPVHAPAILAQPAAVGFTAKLAGPEHSPAAHAFGGGPITPDALASLVMQPADERDLALRPPPESRVRVSPLTGDGLTVSYGLDSSFVMRVLWTLVLTPFIVGGVARLAGEAGASTLTTIATPIPGVAFVAEQVAQWPVVFAIVALLFYVLPTWGLFRLPSGLHVGRDGVRVRRRLWPMTMLLPLDRLSSVRVTDKQVALQRKDASLLRRYVFPAPPMPTNEHARWLAAHLRRAMLMFGGLREER